MKGMENTKEKEGDKKKIIRKGREVKEAKHRI